MSLHVGTCGDTTTWTIVDDDGTTALNLSVYTTKQLHILRPDGTWVIRTPTYTNGTGSNGLVYYTRVAGDRTVSGLYRYQLYLYASANALFRTVEYTEWVDPILMAAT